MKVILIRHGMTEGNKQKRYAGSMTDEPLCKEGIEVLKGINYPKTDKIFVSPMKRCIETADTIFPDCEKTIIEDLREINFGIFENKNHQELDGDTEYQKWLDSMGLSKIPEGESFDELKARSSAALLKAVKEAEDAKSIAIVSHGGTIMALLSALGDYNYFDHIADNGRGYICDFENERLKVTGKL